MHEVVRDELEHHLTGKASPAFYNHVDSCKKCRDEVAEMDEMARILRDFAPAIGDAPVPTPGFYARVASTINEQQPKSAWATMFSPGQLFFRRVALGSMILLTALGTLLISNEASIDGTDATTVMAQYDQSTAHAPAGERDMLLTLVTYH